MQELPLDPNSHVFQKSPSLPVVCSLCGSSKDTGLNQIHSSLAPK